MERKNLWGCKNVSLNKIKLREKLTTGGGGMKKLRVRWKRCNAMDKQNNAGYIKKNWVNLAVQSTQLWPEKGELGHTRMYTIVCKEDTCYLSTCP